MDARQGSSTAIGAKSGRREQDVIEVVTHCYCPPGTDWYAQALRWQLASLNEFAPSGTQLTVYWSGNDVATKRVLDSFPKGRVLVVPAMLMESCLFRRAIGRNQSAISTRADVVWFTDVDYFCPNDFLSRMVPHVLEHGFAFPKWYSICKDWETGDRLVDEYRRGGPFLWSDIGEDFTSKKNRVAIGGVQFVSGDLCRKYGYLKDTDWVKPVDPTLGFRSCKCDRKYRGMLKREAGISATAVDCCGLYRLRHTSDGRDFAASGVKGEGKEYW